MKKIAAICLSAVVVVVVFIAVFIACWNTPERFFKGTITSMEKVDNHLVLTLRENAETEHEVHMRYIDFLKYMDADGNDSPTGADTGDYAHNLEVGDYIEGAYHNKFPYKTTFSKEARVLKK